MLGRPEMVVPVFMNVWAGSWLIASVRMERMMQMSSAIEPMRGNSSQISGPDLPNRLKSYCGAKQLKLLALKLRDRLALGEDFRHRLAAHFAQVWA